MPVPAFQSLKTLPLARFRGTLRNTNSLPGLRLMLTTILLLASAQMIVIDENAVKRDEPPPHGGIGMSTAYRISDAVPAPRSMEFRKRILHPGAAIGLHLLTHDEVYYVIAGQGEVTSDGKVEPLSAGMAAYLFQGATVGIKQQGEEPLTIIISYPNQPAN